MAVASLHGAAKGSQRPVGTACSCALEREWTSGRYLIREHDHSMQPETHDEHCPANVDSTDTTDNIAAEH